MANSPHNARVYRATIAPLDQPAAALTDVSDTPFLIAFYYSLYRVQTPQLMELRPTSVGKTRTYV